MGARRLVLLSLVGLLAVLACGCANEEIADARRALLDAQGRYMLLPRLAAFESRSITLASTLETFCAAPTVEGLKAAQTQWHSTRAPFKETEVFAFGPIKEEPLRIGPKVDFWPARPDAIEEMAASGFDFAGQTAADLGAAHKGLPAIEYLLFGSAPSTDESRVQAFVDENARCAYLVAIGHDLVVRAQSLRAAWDPAEGDYLSVLLDAGRGSLAYDSLDDAVGEIINRIGFTLENIRVGKLERPLGEATGAVQPDKVESRFSGRSVEDILDNLRGLEALVFGRVQTGDSYAEFSFPGTRIAPEGEVPTGPIGLDAYLESRGSFAAGHFADALQEARTALMALGDRVEVVAQDEPEKVREAMTKLLALQLVVQRDFLDALSLDARFNDADGD